MPDATCVLVDQNWLLQIEKALQFLEALHWREARSQLERVNVENVPAGVKRCGRLDWTHVCVLVGGDGDELGLREDEGLSFGGKEGLLGAVLLHLHDVETRLVLVQRLEDDHLGRKCARFQRHGPCYLSHAAPERDRTCAELLVLPLLLVSLSLLKDTSCLIQ